VFFCLIACTNAANKAEVRACQHSGYYASYTAFINSDFLTGFSDKADLND
jgi:hypothetical protein